MSLALLLPIGLLALAGLVVPALLHLARRSEQQVVVFAALQWLQARPRPRRKRRFDERLLLLVRLLLLASLAALLAQPVLLGRPDLGRRVLVAPGVDVATARRDPALATARWHWLAPGFPKVPASTGGAEAMPPPAASGQPGLPSLLREFDADLPAGAALTVLVPAVIEGADAEVPVLARKVDWQVGTGPALPASAAGTAPRAGNGQAAHARPWRVMVRNAPSRVASLRYLRAVDAAWRAAAAVPGGPPARNPAPAFAIAPAGHVLDPAADTLVWLVPGPLPPAAQAWIAAGGTALLDAGTTHPGLHDAPIAWQDEQGVLARGLALGRGRALRLERPLLPATMPVLLEPGFPRHLRALLAAPMAAPTRVLAADYAPRTGATAGPGPPRPLAPGLAVLVALLFLLERWLANGKRQRDAA